jgi:hypothetical protein
MKTCSKCKTTKPNDAFSFDKRAKDGRAHNCRQCNIAASRRWQANNPERVKIAKATHLKRNYHKIRAYDLKKRAENPDAYAARAQVNNGLRAGKISKKPCEVCGEPKSQAHHYDYSRPLDVVWLCPKHHAEAHKKSA